LTEFDLKKYNVYKGKLLSLTKNIDIKTNCLSNNNSETESLYFLFNIKDDPYEKNNLAFKYPCKLKELELKLEEYKHDSVVPLVTEPANFDKKSNPNANDQWAPGWCL
jgi:hypothetical protein